MTGLSLAWHSLCVPWSTSFHQFFYVDYTSTARVASDCSAIAGSVDIGQQATDGGKEGGEKDGVRKETETKTCNNLRRSQRSCVYRRVPQVFESGKPYAWVKIGAIYRLNITRVNPIFSFARRFPFS